MEVPSARRNESLPEKIRRRVEREERPRQIRICGEAEWQTQLYVARVMRKVESVLRIRLGCKTEGRAKKAPPSILQLR